MTDLDQVAKYFEGEIEKIVAQQEKELKEEIETLRQATKMKIEERAQVVVAQYEKQKEEDLIREVALKKSNIKQEYYKKLMDYRNHKAEMVFDELKNMCRSYTEQQVYKDALNSAISQFADKEVDIYVREEDMGILDVKVSNVKVSQHIQFGGYIVEHHDSNRIIDETLDSKIEEQKMWFYENSRLELN